MGLPEADWLWHAEVEPFPCAVMAARHPSSVNLGNVLASDFVDRALAFGPLDLMAGGPPCQGFSVAGLRGGMSDPRGNLSLRWVQILHAIRPRNAVTENVPGWLSMPDNAFGCFLAGLVGADDALHSPDGGSWPGVGMVAGPRARAAWRVLDAQYFGVAQRRRRVFVVADFGDGADPVEVLFERAGLHGNTAPSREARERAAPTISARTKGGDSNRVDNAAAGYMIPIAFPAKLSSTQCASSEQLSPVLSASHTMAVGFDTTQITSPSIYSYPQSGDPCHPLAAGAHPPAVAFALRGREDGAVPEVSGDAINALRSASGGSSRDYVAVPADSLALNLEAEYSNDHASTPETDAYSLLLDLRKAAGEEAFAEWGLGISHSLQSPDVLRPGVHGAGVRGQTENGDELGDDALPCSQDGSAGTVQSLWGAGCAGRSPSGWQPSEQLAEQLGAHLSILPHKGASRARLLHDLWRASEGLGLLREALSAFQEARRSAEGSYQASADMQRVRGTGAQQGLVRNALHEGEARWAVRRLLPSECAKLQGFAPDYLDITFRNKPAADGNKYKALGNSWAVPCGAWVLRRLVEAMPEARRDAA
jgi:DNA (cytosine-5)-methyltransferase 1